MSRTENDENLTKCWKSDGWHTYEPVDKEYEAKFKCVKVSMDSDWKMLYTYGMVWMKELSTSLKVGLRSECLAIVYAMLKACDRGVVPLDSWGPTFRCPSGHQLKSLIAKVIGEDDMEAVEWFTASVVDTGKQIILEKNTKSKVSEVNFAHAENRITSAVKRTFWRIDEGMFRASLVLHVFLRCGQKLSIDDPVIILGSAHASMIHDALSILRDSKEEQDKSPASVLNVSRAAYGQTILFCVKLGDIAMRNVCDTNIVWTIVDNFSTAHFFLNTGIKEYGVADKMLAPIHNFSNNNGICVPQINGTVVEYYCEFLREASKEKIGDMPWKGTVDGGLNWLKAAIHAATYTIIEPGLPAQIRANIVSQNISLRTTLGIELLKTTSWGKMAHFAYYYAYTSFGKHFDNRFVEAVAVLLAKLELGARMKDAGSKIPELYSLCMIPQHLIDEAWDVIASITSCNEHRLQLVKNMFEKSFALRSTSTVRHFAKAASEQLPPDSLHKKITPSANYSKYIERRLIDGYWVFIVMLNLLYETGRPEDIDSPGLLKMLEASLLFFEESTRVRRIFDDEGFGYWSCLSKDEQKAREFGRNRARVLWRQGWDEMSENGENFAAVFVATAPFKHDYTGLPGTAPWLALQNLL